MHVLPCFLDSINISAAVYLRYKSPMFNSYSERRHHCSPALWRGCARGKKKKKASSVVHNAASKLAPWYDCALLQSAFGRSTPLSPVGTVSPSFKFDFPPRRLSSGAGCDWHERTSFTPPSPSTTDPPPSLAALATHQKSHAAVWGCALCARSHQRKCEIFYSEGLSDVAFSTTLALS